MKPLDLHVANLASFPIKQRNTLLDSIFYDTESLAADQQARLNPLVDREGSIIVVSPREHNNPIRHYKNALRFMNREGDSFQALVIAGVGSSALGTAALARNVADHYGFDVAGLVSGYGLAEMITEAMGGWFFYGYLDVFRNALEWATGNLWGARQRLGPALPAEPASLTGSDFGFSTDSAASATLKDILAADPAGLKLVVGHSKGCLLTGVALRCLVTEMGEAHLRLYDTLTIVTLGAVVSIPDRFKRRHQFLGELDWFGAMNSRLDIPHTMIPNAWHHLNTHTPFCMSVGDVLHRVPALAPAHPAGKWGRHNWEGEDVL